MNPAEFSPYFYSNSSLTADPQSLIAPKMVLVCRPGSLAHACLQEAALS